MHPAKSASAAPRKQAKRAAPHPILMFHYPSQLSFVGSEKTRVAVKRRDWPCFAAEHRNVATHRILSQSAVIGRKTSCAAQGEKNCRPEAPSPFPYL
jgi:hypothetical protein